MTRTHFRRPGLIPVTSTLTVLSLASSAFATDRTNIVSPPSLSPVPQPWGESPLWQNSVPRPRRNATQRDFTDALNAEISVLGRLRDWRETMRGGGKSPRRSFALTPVGNGHLQFAIGRQDLPLLTLAGLGGGTTGSEIRLGRVAAGTTWRGQSLTRALDSYDRLMEGNAATAHLSGSREESQLNWLTARPIENDSGSLNLLLARGRRQAASAGARSVDGNFMGASAQWKLPAQWKLNAEFVNSRLSTQEEGANAWKLALDGPVRHPWGEARVAATLGDQETGFSTWSDTLAASQSAEQLPPIAGRESGTLSLQQDVALGDLSGAFKLALAQNRHDAPASGAATQTDKAEGTADLRWKLHPALTLTATGSRRSEAVELASPESTTENATSEQSRLSAVQAGDVGVELGLSRSLSFRVSTGQTRGESSLSGGEALTPLAHREEERVALGLRRQRARGGWGVELGRTTRDEASLETGAMSSTDSISESLRLEAERQLFSQLRVKGILHLSGERDLWEQLSDERARRAAEAQFMVKSLGRFDLRYSDSQNANASNADAGNSGVLLDGTREYGARLNFGSAAQGNGFGLAVEYARKAVSSNPDAETWRIGVTYK